MSNQGTEELYDRIEDNLDDLMDEWLDTDSGWGDFVAWLWSSRQEKLFSEIKKKFLEDYSSREKEHFDRWCVDEMSNREDGSNEDLLRGDR